jgi:N4-gp56 family major capsid protein
MPDVQTTSSALSAAMTFKVQRGVLQNLRASLVFADDAFAEQGEFDSGRDTLMFVAVPDLPINVTPLTEGTRPNKRALSITTVTVSADQYGDLVSITDIAKVKSPIEIVPIGIERLSRQAKESLDQISRDVIALGGTTYFGGVGNPANRAAIAATDLTRAADLRKLKTKMRKGKIDPADDGFYRLWVHPNVAYDLKNEGSGTAVQGSFNDVNKYTGNTPLIRGEIGSLEGFRIMEVINAPTFASTVTVYRSIALGREKGWGTGDLQTLQTFHVLPGGDHADPMAQEELMAWKVAFGVAVLSNQYYFGMETAATNV